MEHVSDKTGAAAADAATMTAVDVRERLREIRARLPGQVLVERIEIARAAYGPLYSLDDVRARVAATLPWRPGFGRHAALEPIETYRQRIPDEVLLKYDDARRSGLFADFVVATPVYRRDAQADPWLVAHVAGTELYAIIGQWM